MLMNSSTSRVARLILPLLILSNAPTFLLSFLTSCSKMPATPMEVIVDVFVYGKIPV
jgi:hypothetical protein